MADIGHEVMGVAVDESKTAALAEGRPPLFEPGLSEVLARTVHSGKLRFSTSLAPAAEFGDAHFICVGTPQRPGSYAADMKHIDAVVAGLAPHLQRECLVVGKSTVPVGTASRLAAQIAGSVPAGAGAEVAWNPEFLREGHAVSDTLHPDRLVAGVTSDRADGMLREIYAPIIAEGTPYISTDLATAELVKVSANAFLATKISFINAMSDICEAAGGDVVTLAEAIGHDTRIGHRFLSAGLGFGGGCLPKDIRAFMARAGELGVEEALLFLREIDEINMRRRTRTVDMARALVGGSFLGKNVAILGAAFKPESDDVRDSPALNVAAAIHLQGGQVRIHDPEALDNARALFPTLDYVRDIPKACEQADIVLHLTEWSQYGQLDTRALATLVRTPLVLDTRNALDIDQWRSTGWTVRSLGRPNR